MDVKLFKPAAVLALAALCSPSLSFAAPVASNPNGIGNIVLQPTNQDIDIISISDSGVSWDYTLYMFDDSADISLVDPNDGGFVNDDSVLAVDPIPTQLNFAGTTVSRQGSSDQLLLSGNDHFIFALWNHDYQGGTWIEATTAELFDTGIPDVYNIRFAFNNPDVGLEETVVFSIDVQPVPLPGAAGLFAAALLGLSRMKRRA